MYMYPKQNGNHKNKNTKETLMNYLLPCKTLLINALLTKTIYCPGKSTVLILKDGIFNLRIDFNVLFAKQTVA